MVTRAERARAKQQQILTAAVALFAERGFEGTSTDAITAGAGVSKETLYRYYPSKEQLLVAAMQELVLEGTFTGASLQLPAEATREDLERVLRALAGAVIDRVITPEYLALARLLLAESGRRPELAQMFRSLVPEAGASAIIAILTQARDRGLLRGDVDLGAALWLFAGPLLLSAVTGMLAGGEGPRRPDDAQVAAMIRLFLDGTAT
jgi:TetR/AcrR family transcriptional regulator, mexJK operon transcriptional repressor